MRRARQHNILPPFLVTAAVAGLFGVVSPTAYADADAGSNDELQPASTQAPAALPSADNFTIRYRLIDKDDGNRQVRQMDAQDMRQFLNQARCACEENIEAEILLQKNTGEAYDNVQIASYVGTMCANAEVNPIGQFRECAKFNTLNTPAWQNGFFARFAPVWLVNGVNPQSPSRNPNDASTIPVGTCDASEGQGGIWMCADSNGANACQAEEFFITGTTNINTANTDTPQGINFDFRPPATVPEESSFNFEVGDGSVSISWSLLTPGDLYGYRILCADAETGAPALETSPVKSLETLRFTRPDGTNYFTPGNLCPGSVPVCGDGVVANTEECDLGDANDNSGECTERCALAVCGDGFVQAGEACDDGPGAEGGALATETCSASCQAINRCGDGTVDPGEACDDGADLNGTDMSDCSATCASKLCAGGGTGTTGTGGTTGGTGGTGGMTDGTGGTGNPLDEQATTGTTGGGTDDPPPYECDPDSDPNCLPTCLLNVCGDGVVGEGEECDDGNTVSTDGCITIDLEEANESDQAKCVLATCGDGFIGPGEVCDEGEENGVTKPCTPDCRVNDALSLPTGGIQSLDWSYVCSDHLANTTTNYRVSGLDNSKTYDIMVVAYDLFGNPVPVAYKQGVEPRETVDWWELCEKDGTCGASGFCNISDRVERDGGRTGLGMLGVFGLIGLLGVATRTRRRRSA